MAYREQTVVGQEPSASVQNGLASGLIQWDGFDPLSLLLPSDDYSTLQVYVLVSSKTEHFTSSQASIQSQNDIRPKPGRLLTRFQKPFQLIQGEVSSALIP